MGFVLWFVSVWVVLCELGGYLGHVALCLVVLVVDSVECVLVAMLVAIGGL